MARTKPEGIATSTKAKNGKKNGKKRKYTLPTAPRLAFEPSYMEKTYFVDVQSALGPQKKRLAVIWELKKAVELYLFLKGGPEDIEERLYKLVLPERLMARLRQADGESYTLPSLASLVSEDGNVEVRYMYMVNNWDQLSEGHTALQLNRTKFLSYSSFIQNITRFRKICVHYCLFIYHCRRPIDEICKKFEGCKKIIDIDRKVQNQTLHWNFASKTLKFEFKEPELDLSEDDTEDEEDEASNTKETAKEKEEVDEDTEDEEDEASKTKEKAKEKDEEETEDEDDNTKADEHETSSKTKGTEDEEKDKEGLLAGDNDVVMETLSPTDDMRTAALAHEILPEIGVSGYRMKKIQVPALRS